MYSENDFYKIKDLLKKSNIGYEDLRDIVLENITKKNTLNLKKIEIKELEIFMNNEYNCYFVKNEKDYDYTCFVYDKNQENKNNLSFTNKKILEIFLNKFGFTILGGEI